ncbi:hypothetical protein MKW98_015621 [Papaver atlanticum]|uniref:Exosome RNA helicase MTR4-like beta-barrel domain-containing protein n=1 Tax=Papaver atlanticum TaxID=357466 RepID=A0AAD4S4L8_9MAGN|nr:hypothetical protein MKW98_015621 [Papaver atlanticum]
MGQIAEAYLGSTVKNAVIRVPAYFNDSTGATDWGWGVVVNVVRKPSSASSTLPASSSRGSDYIVDTLLHCSPGSSENGTRSKPSPSRPGERGEMHVELGTRFPQCLPKLNPVKDMAIEDQEFVDVMSQIEELEKKLHDHPVHKSILL